MDQSKPQAARPIIQTTTALNPIPGPVYTSMLDQYLVEDKDLRVPELCYRVPVDFTIKPKDDPRVDDAKSLVVALGNSYGGVITLAGGIRVDDLTLDSWQMAFWDQLKSVLPESFITNGLKLVKEDQDTFNLLVKRSHDLLTKNYGLYTRVGPSNHLVQDVRTANMIMKSVPSNPPPGLPDSERVCGAVTSLQECEHTDFKCWKARGAKEISNKLQDNRTQNGIFAMVNLTSGGNIFIGIEEAKDQKVCKVKGQILSESDEETLTKAIESLMNQEPSGEKRVWGTERTVAKKNSHWAVEYIPLTGCPSGERRVVIQLKLYHCQGGMYRRKPESFKMSPQNRVERLDFKSWKHELSKSAKNLEQITTLKPNKPHHITLSNVLNMPTSALGQATLSYPTAAPATQNTSPVTYTVLETVDRLSWSEHADWEEYNTVRELTLDHIEAINEVITLSCPVTFAPNEAAITSAMSREETLIQKAIQETKQDLVSAKAFVVASTRLSKDFIPSCTWPSDHMLDFLSLDDSCTIRLWAIYSHIDNQKKTKQAHLMVLGRSLKKALMETKLKGEFSLRDVVPAIFVKTKLSPSSGISANTLFDACCDFFQAQSGQLDTLKHALGLLLCGQNATFHIKQTADESELIHLTLGQMAQVLGSEVSKFNLIEGPPGSGKTLLALYLCQRLFGVENSAVLCTNPCLVAYYRHQGIDATRVTDLKKQVEEDILKENTCLILDDCQNLECDQMAMEYLYQQVQLKRDAHLFMLFDNSIQNFSGTQNVEMIKKSFEKVERLCGCSYMRKQLSVVHRNTQRVVSYIASSSPQHTIVCGNNLQGDDVEIRRLLRLREQGPGNDIIRLVEDLVAVPTGDIKGRYVPKDIAIAVDGSSHQTDKDFYTKLFLKHAITPTTVHGADSFPRTGLTIDHLDHFSGLDSKVFILVAPNIVSSFSKKSGSSNRSISDPKYRAFVASRGVARVIFVTDSPLSPENATIMRSEGSRLAASARQTSRHATLVSHIQLQGAVADLDFGPGGRLFITSGQICKNKRRDNVFENCQLQTYDKRGHPAPSPIPDSHTNIRSVSCLSDRVVVYDRDSEAVHIYLYKETGDGQTRSTQIVKGRIKGHLAVTTDGRIICVRHDRLWCLGEDGTEVWRRTLRSSEHRYSPCVAVDADSIVVTNRNTRRVTVYDHSGNPTASLPTDRLCQPQGACLVSEGRILVTEHASGEVLMFTKTGDFLGVLVAGVNTPVCVSVREDGYLAVGTTEDGVYLYSLT